MGSIPIRSHPNYMLIYGGKLFIFGLLNDINSASSKYGLE
jgi:hypothetical protein